ncbi:glycosyltransferase [Salinimonas lutimaris]|uniref:glycosyltransferase n=1 Tax=Salinimonas lutimaris TaxID=914153 RepID=UPI001E4E0C74|nr:glycosyltransferase [Salinimonas lutimaris]
MPDSNPLSFRFIVPPKQTVTTPALVAMSTYHKDDPDWLEQAILSVLEQTYTAFTFLIILDGDVSSVAMRRLLRFAGQDSRIVIAQNSRQSGLAASMNKAIEWMLSGTRCEYFFRMDADDRSLPERFEKQIEFLESHPEVHVLGTALTEINEHGVKVGSRVMPSSHHVIVRALPRRCTLNHPTVVMRRSVFEQNMRYDSELQNTQDYFLWISLAARGMVIRNLREKHLEFRRVNDFYKRRGLTKSLNECRARFIAMQKLRRYSVVNITYAIGVLCLRLMPSRVVRLAYKLDRLVLEKIVRH